MPQDFPSFEGDADALARLFTARSALCVARQSLRLGELARQTGNLTQPK